MVRAIQFIENLTKEQIKELAGGSLKEYKRLYAKVNRIYNEEFRQRVLKSQKKYNEKKKMQKIENQILNL